MGDIEHLDFTPGSGVLNAAVKAWSKPIEPYLKTVAATRSKPLAELTMPDLLAWAFVFTYAALTGMVIGQVTGNVLSVALRGPLRR
jgi:hypothetical protein